MNEVKDYNEKILRVYVDFYNNDRGFLKTFEKAVESGLEKSLERDELAIRRLLRDIARLEK